ncbi:hypothetical protein PR202_ga01907 [Eleusine coracana subsp. coracana]|uniref:Uncharacterized protein n=1 Tax=Eleusine coracana subsp. coracana TaxID=191504 RepID=A0AAV5BJG4_ELECO|nr:hypothetical protein PR202_ga01220 [Eleusine coracana subsp. coracana]GJM86087.1 hypothetical protein PR202_ga01907 [Eleusine coracana subsp. coracana]
MTCLDAPPRLGLRPAPCQPHGVRRPPWRLGLFFSSSCRSCTPVSRQLTICNANSYADDLWVAAPQSPASVRSRLLAAEREEAKAVLSLFLRQKGLRSTLAARIVNKSDGFIEHLVSKLQNTYRSRYVEGRELSTPEIRDALLPYLEALSREHGDGLVEVVENFPDPFSTERKALSSSMVLTPTSSNKQKAIARISTPTLEGTLPELVLFLLELGMDHEEIKNIVRKFPAFAYYNVDRKIKPLVELLIELGNKVETTVSFLTELGVSKENIGKILTRCPHLMSYSVDDNLRPTAEYFRSIGADVASLIQKSPQAFGLNVEAKLKPITEFFLERGF